MSTDIFTQAQAVSGDDERNERARRAVSAFRVMQPGLTAYARAMTKSRVEVVLSAGTSRTDGTKIYYRPPIELGDNTPHDRNKCDRRDSETREQLCLACRVREEVNISMYHEMGHIIGGTVARVTNAEKLETLRHSAEMIDTDDAKQLLEKLNTHDWELKQSNLMGIGRVVSPYLPLLYNNLEDSRVDALMFTSRPGMKAMFHAFVLKVFQGRYEKADGDILDWKEAEPNAQILIGCFLKASQYKFDDWLHPQVVEALQDERLTELLARVENMRSATGIFSLCIPVLVRLRELGYCLTPDERQEDESDEGSTSAEQSDKSEDETGGSSDNPDTPASGNEPDESLGSQGDSDLEEKPDSESVDQGSPGSGDSEAETDEHGGPSEDKGDSDDSPGGSGDESSDEWDEPFDSDESSPSSEWPDGEDTELGDTGSGGTDEGDDQLEGDSEEDGGGAVRPLDRPEGKSDPETLGEASHQEDDGQEELSDDAESSESSPETGKPEDAGSGDNGSQDAEEAGDTDGGIQGTGEISSTSESGTGTGVGSEPGQSSESESSDGDDKVGTDSGDDSRDEKSVSQTDELIDSGADEGKGGVELEFGDPEETEEIVTQFSYHEGESVLVPDEPSPEDEAAIDVAIIQGLYFEKPSTYVRDVRLHKYGVPTYDDGTLVSRGWQRSGDSDWDKRRGQDHDIEVEEEILGPGLKVMRRVFGDNKRHGFERNKKSGKVNSRVLGKRAPVGDPRVFKHKTIPKKKSHGAVLGIDISASTIGMNILLAKIAASGQAELMQRAGVEFAIYAHTAQTLPGLRYDQGLALDIYVIKEFRDPWGPEQKAALANIAPVAENLDGHGIEFYRKILEKQDYTDKYLLYYSDGKMPAANYNEELEILQREIKYCKAHDIHLLGVGIRTDSPQRHGLDTVQVNSEHDLPAVIEHLERNLLHR